MTAPQQDDPSGGERFPLSPAQEHLLVLEEMHPGTSLYNVPLAFVVRGAWDAAALRRALDTVVARHEALRTVFLTSAVAAPVQVVSDEVRTDVRHERDVPAEAATALLRAAAREPFDLAAGPLVRCLIQTLDDGDHAVLLVVHHLVCDGWSMDVLLAELSAAYRAATGGPPFAPEHLPVQFADVAAWQVDQLAAGAYQSSVEHWVRELRGAPTVLDLPVDRPRPAVASVRGAEVRLPVRPSVRAALSGLARERGVTPFTVLLSALAVFLERLTGQDDLLIGVPAYARGRPECAGLVGLLTNTVAIRVVLTGDPTFHDVVDQVAARLLAARAHEEVPFDAVVSAVAPQAAPGRTPLVQVLLDHVADGSTVLDLPGAAVTPVPIPVVTAQFDLAVYVEQCDDELVTRFLYRTDLHDAATIHHWADNVHTTLEGLLTASAAPVRDAAVLAPAERRAAVGLEDAPVALPADAPLVGDLIAARAAGHPDDLAVVHADRTLTYGGLLARADALAGRLRRTGVGPGAVIGILVARSVDQVVAVVAAWRAGAAFVALDLAHPQARLAFLAADSGAELILATAATAYLAATLGPPVLSVDDEDAAPGGPGPGPTGRDLATVVYTSGTTGAPKGVAIEHRALTDLVGAIGPITAVRAGDQVLQHASFGVDGAVADLCLALTAGATLHVADEHERIGDALFDRLHAARITYVYLSPTAAATVPDPHRLTALRTLDLGGEPCPADLVSRWAAPGRTVLNGYGPTEATVVCTYATLEPGAPVRIGHAVPGGRVVVLDERLRPVPIGAVGELYVAGNALARGYVGRAAETAHRFVADPYGPPGSRMYRTGDRGCRHPDGSLSYVGRVDGQVQVRGFRVELAEIESVLAELPGVAAAAVALRGPTTDPVLVAYVVDGTAPPSDQLLIEHVAARLPRHTVPAAVVRIDALPVGRSGKLDRDALPPPPAVRVVPRRDDHRDDEPSGPVERFVAEIWQRVLGRDRVGRGDNFLDVGGNSLRLLHVLTALRGHENGAGIGLLELFGRPTVAAQAALLDQPDARSAPAPQPPGPPDDAARRGRDRRRRQAARRGHRTSKGTTT